MKALDSNSLKRWVIDAGSRKLRADKRGEMGPEGKVLVIRGTTPSRGSASCPPMVITQS